MITNIQSLRSWFLDQKRPYWSLNNNGVGRGLIARNESIEDVDTAWTLLETNVLAQAEGGIANVKIFVTDKPKHNHGMETEARILPAYSLQTAGQPGIGNLPANYMDESKIQGMIADAKEKWELERRIDEMEAALSAPSGWVDKLMEGVERIGSTPLGQMLAARLMGVPPTAMANVAAAPGVPFTGAAAPSTEGDDDGEEYGEKFYDDMEATAATLGVTPELLAEKLAALVTSNPDLAKSFLK